MAVQDFEPRRTGARRSSQGEGVTCIYGCGARYPVFMYVVPVYCARIVLNIVVRFAARDMVLKLSIA